jgi:hypothetical protein
MEGYAKLANLMALSPELAILRNFAALRIQNLLYLQAELTLLEERLQEYAAADSAAKRIAYTLDWEQLHASYTQNPFPHSLEEVDALPEDQRQWPTVLLMRKKLEEYGKLNAVIE